MKKDNSDTTPGRRRMTLSVIWLVHKQKDSRPNKEIACAIFTIDISKAFDGKKTFVLSGIGGVLKLQLQPRRNIYSVFAYLLR